MKKKEPNFTWQQYLKFRLFGVRRVDVLKLALVVLEYNHEVYGRHLYLCKILYHIMLSLRMVGLDPADRIPDGFKVHEFIPKFERPYGIAQWTIPWWDSSEYYERKEFLLELIEYYKNDKERFPINIYHYD